MGKTNYGTAIGLHCRWHKISPSPLPQNYPTEDGGTKTLEAHYTEDEDVIGNSI